MNRLILNGRHHAGRDIEMENLAGIAAQRVTDEMVTLPVSCISGE